MQPTSCYCAGWTLTPFLLQLSVCDLLPVKIISFIQGGLWASSLSGTRTRFTNWWSNWSPTVTGLTLVGISCVLENKCQTTNFPVLCIGVSALCVDGGWTFPLPRVLIGVFCFPPLPVLQIESTTLWFPILLPYIYFIETLREGERQTEGQMVMAI